MLSARRLLRRARRAEEGLFLIEGERALAEAVGCGAAISEVFVQEGMSSAAAAGAVSRGARHYAVPRKVISALSDATAPQGVVAVAASPIRGELPPGAEFVVVLAEVSDPGNAGTIVRTAAAAGADGVVLTPGSVDPLNPKTVRASAGSLFRVPVVSGSGLQDIKDLGLRLVGTAADASVSLYEADLSGRIALVFGSEAHGLPAAERAALDAEVAIPMPGGAESLNVGVAASIVIFEALRARSAVYPRRST